MSTELDERNLMSTEVNLSDIKVDPRRKKRNLGDIESLKASIEDVGLLHPLVLRPGNHLVVGYRRMEALAQLGHKTAPAIVAANLAELNQALKAERDENTCREAPMPSYAVELGLEIEKAYKPTADAARAEGQKAGGKTAGKGRPKANSSGETFAKAKRDNSKRTTAQAAAGVGMSDRAYEKAKAVVKSGRVDLIKSMDTTGKVDGAYKKLKIDESPATTPATKPKKVAGPKRITEKRLTELIAIVKSLKQNADKPKLELCILTLRKGINELLEKLESINP